MWRGFRPFIWLVLAVALAVFVARSLDGQPTVDADAAALAGQPTSITDGDTFRLAGERIRLHGIDAPEMSTPEGHLARSHLGSLIAGGSVVCDDTGQRSHDRVVAVCRGADGQDLAAQMVSDGWATDWPRYSMGRYAAHEAQARLAGRGMHASQ